MKKLIQVVCLTLLASVASAQETYSVAITNVNNVAKIELGRVQHNLDRCEVNSQPEGCTQAQVCVAANVAGGASCTVGAAIAAGQRIYPNSLAGRESFVANELVRASMDGFVQKQKHLDLNKARAFCSAATQIQLDAICSAFGLSAGCFVCPLQ